MIEHKRNGTLPAELTSFVGRRHELSAVKRLLTESRLVTLTGPGGVGKTRLALRAAAEVRRSFTDGVWLISLAELSDPGLLTQTVAAALGIQDYSRQGLMVTLEEFLRGRQLLLIMDNCEHLVDSCAVLVNELLPVAPGMRILATSRQSLSVTAEQVLAVPPLSLPPLSSPPLSGQATRGKQTALDPPGDPYAPTPTNPYVSEAVELFTDRARAVLPDFTLTPENSHAVAEICLRLDGIPLALELAAVRLRVLSARQILERLADRFRLLTAGNRAAVSRQQTLRALIAWSYDHCTAAERALWERTSVFSGGFDLAAAEFVCASDGIAPDEVLGLIDALVDKSLLSAEDEGHGEIRYRMLETIREYAHDRLTASGQLATFRRRHRDYFQSVAEAASQEWFGPEQPAVFARLRRELANLRAALDFCLSEPGQAQIALTITSDAYFFFWLGYMSEGRWWFDRALALAPEPTPARTTALWSNAWLAGQQGDFAAVRAMVRECCELADMQGDRAGHARAVGAIGWVALCEGDLASAFALLEEAVAGHHAVGDTVWVIHNQTLIAVTAYLSGDTERAVSLCENSRALCEAEGELWNHAWVDLCHSWIMWRQGDRRRAEELAKECLRVNSVLDDRLDLAHSLDFLAWVAAADDPKRAARLLGSAHAAMEAIGAPLYTFARPDHDQCVTATKAALGAKAFTKMFEAGAAFTIEEAIAEGMAEKRQRIPTRTVAPTQDRTGTLTRREREVAALVANGLTNREVAEKLMISPRTAEGHVDHIMTKLGLTSRTQIVAVLGQTPGA